MKQEPPSLFNMTAYLRTCALDAIKYAETPGEAKRRIMLARDMGLLDDEETADWIGMFGVVVA